MNDSELCKMFGTTLGDVEADAEKYEQDDLSDFEFGTPIDGKPTAQMKVTSFKLFDFEIAAIDREAKARGMSRSAFIRSIIDNELVALA